MTRSLFSLLLVLGSSIAVAGTSEFCLEGELDLGARYQGLRPQGGEWYPARWCVTTEDGSGRVFFEAKGKANADLEDDWAVPRDRSQTGCDR